ncbi:unnamed protein product [Paramecium octaurelia]|uniref:Exonuclease domain-containing protein n=1 Tax=Paramecium octaurelia TaxID=43137 RepID=A0A8S1XJL2_PAROT|nr:unnamed protein product [Paramecium octaurelia]
MQSIGNKSPLKHALFWLDMEMTGLNVFEDQIIECACILTDYKLQTIIKGPHIVIHADKQVLDGMDQWCTTTHKASGLYQESLNSTVTVGQAQEQILQFLNQNNIPPKVLPLAGNSVYMDRLFVMKHMPQLDQFLHYRIVDVSSIKLLCQNLNPIVCSQQPQKKLNHRALDDILESIEELRYYQQKFMVCQQL